MPKAFQLLHLSGLGNRDDRGGSITRSNQLDQLIARVQEDRRRGMCPDIVVVSGNVAEEGTEGEYEAARIFFDNLLAALNVEQDRLFIVPGSHDVNQKKYRPTDIPAYDTVRDLNAELSNEVYRNDLFKGLAEYFDFAQGYLPHLNKLQGNLVPFVNTIEQTAPLKRIALVGLNSAWMCRRSIGDRSIAIGEHQVKIAMEVLRNAGDIDLQVVIFHHPLSSLWLADRTICKSYLHGSVVLCGNLHDAGSAYFHDFDGSIYQFATGNATVDSSSPWPGRFQYVTFDWEAREIRLDLRTYVSEQRKWVVDAAAGEDGRKVIPLYETHYEAAGAEREEAAEKEPQWSAEDENIRHYTQWAAKKHRCLSVQGVEATFHHPIEIKRVYVNLYAHMACQDQSGAWIDGEGEMEGSEGSALPTVDIQGAFAALEHLKIKDMVILGAPGSGKTTLLKYLLMSIIDGEGEQELGLDSSIIPFFSSLKELKNPEDESFADFMRRECQLDTFSISDASFREMLDTGRAIILLDGLDEVVGEDARLKTCQWIESARREFPRTRFVITSRFGGYSGKCRLKGDCLEISLRDFSLEDVETFLVNWFETVEALLHPADDEEWCRSRGREKALVLFNTVMRLDGLVELAVNPLLLQIIALVHRDRAGALPPRRVELYEECLNVLLEKWDAAKELDVLLTAREARQVLQPLALWFHEDEQPRYAPLADIAKIVKEPLERIGKTDIAPERLLQDFDDRSGIITAFKETDYGFSYLSFQEYLAAVEIRNSRRIELLLEKYGQKRWDEVILLSLALNNPSIFEEFLEQLIPTNAFLEETGLVLDALQDSVVKPIKPLVHAVMNDMLALEARYNALRALKHIGGPRAIDTLKTCVSSEDMTLARLAFEALESLGAAAGVGRPEKQEAPKHIVSAEAAEIDVLIPAGPFLFGSGEDDNLARSDEKPQRSVNLPDYYIDLFPVTNDQYCQFLNAALPGEDSLREWIDLDGEFMRERCRVRKRKGKYGCERGYERHPVIYVSWYGANEYATWAGKRLPTEQEWEKASRGIDGLIYPWGDTFDKMLCNTKESGINGTSAVDRFLKGRSPYGCYDMAGNVWEWTSSYFDEDEERMAVRGGSWLLNYALARCAARVRTLPYDWYLSLGFRCARDKD